jgi:hypothetical protein
LPSDPFEALPRMDRGEVEARQSESWKNRSSPLGGQPKSGYILGFPQYGGLFFDKLVNCKSGIFVGVRSRGIGFQPGGLDRLKAYPTVKHLLRFLLRFSEMRSIVTFATSSNGAHERAAKQSRSRRIGPMP